MARPSFIVMEYLAGRSLAQLVRERGRLAPGRAVAVAGQIANALAAAHAAGIIHRDIKPANVMIDDADAVKVLDFGIARAAGGTSLTQTAMVLGSAPYLAPEVTRGERADERSDIYSLRCLLYELLTGRPPFTAELPAAVMHMHHTALPRPPRERNPEVPTALDALVAHMLAKRPGDRPRSARALAAELSASPQARRLDPARTSPLSPTGAWATVPTRVLRPRRRIGRGGRIAAAGLALLAVAGLLFVLLGSSSSPRRVNATGAPSNLATGRARTTHTTAATSATSPASTSTPQSTTSTVPPTASTLTVPSAAGALTTLITQDLQTGAIDQHGQDLLNHLQDILNSYEQQHASDALHKLDDLVKHLGDLADHGDIRPSALPAITTAVGNLRTAILRSVSTSTNTPTGPGGPPPGPRNHPPANKPPRPSEGQPKPH
jgi:serine/threonine-protein kinase